MLINALFATISFIVLSNLMEILLANAYARQVITMIKKIFFVSNVHLFGNFNFIIKLTF